MQTFGVRDEYNDRAADKTARRQRNGQQKQRETDTQTYATVDRCRVTDGDKYTESNRYRQTETDMRVTE